MILKSLLSCTEVFRISLEPGWSAHGLARAQAVSSVSCHFAANATGRFLELSFKFIGLAAPESTTEHEFRDSCADSAAVDPPAITR